ncbi:type II toxin-antitoxin system VapC family toxin [Jiella sp. MQZ9-1]|uniref:Type II toxin-antitoxin system VapC family toxin n=1 Tax=Jiella flava TaxID=2816857 RepID=A0A939JU93_9HYPH|nr:type II toxin-antitoxin system VapC family toxin [Jiella flava]MBO0662945.1 type II toxin-antitoxin system VapC family toxin [Jiella flava]MCD2471295.1 type II toxin-antitoxin system VapC family toxin [Jiella flava]
MRYLLDTHALAWWLLNDPRLSRAAADAIAEPDHMIAASAASAFEIATKYRLGKWPEIAPIAKNFDALVRAERFSVLAVTAAHALLAGRMPGAHKDPFDRLLAAQATVEDLVVVTVDTAFDGFGVPRLW